MKDKNLKSNMLIKLSIAGAVCIAIAVYFLHEEPEMKIETNSVTTPTNLKAALDDKKAAFTATASEDVKTAYADGIRSVTERGILARAKQLGDAAPDFALTNAKGDTVRLSDYLKQGPVILTWYRGGWCPYCNLTLNALQQALPSFKAAEANLIALTPELPDKSLSTADKNALEFEVLSDIGNKVAREYGIVFKLTDAVAKMYEEKFGMSKYNGDDSNELPLAATYIINSEGKIIYAFLDADYRNRAEPSAITAILNEQK